MKVTVRTALEARPLSRMKFGEWGILVTVSSSASSAPGDPVVCVADAFTGGTPVFYFPRRDTRTTSASEGSEYTYRPLQKGEAVVIEPD